MIELIIIAIVALYFVFTLLRLAKYDNKNIVLPKECSLNWFFMLGKILLTKTKKTKDKKLRSLVIQLKISALIFFIVSLLLILTSGKIIESSILYHFIEIFSR